MFLTVFVISLIILAFVILGLGVQIFFSKKKAFPEIHIGHNKEMRKRKIYCAQSVDIGKNGCKCS